MFLFDIKMDTVTMKIVTLFRFFVENLGKVNEQLFENDVA